MKNKKVDCKKPLFSSVAMLLLSAMVLTTSTMAWLSMNKKVESEGMEMEISTSADLVIADTFAKLKAYTATATTGESNVWDLAAASSNYVQVVWGTNTSKLIAATHDGTYTTYATGLKYNTNPYDVSRSTGLKAGDTELTFAAAVNSTDATGNTYYIDYPVYIGSLEQDMAVSKLTFDLSTSTEFNDNNSEYKAASVDVYAKVDTVGDSYSVSSIVGTDNYVGTLNLSGAENTNTKNKTASITIPKTGESMTGALVVLFRCYFDGALQIAESNPATTYITSDALVTMPSSAVKFNISITADKTA